MITVNVITQVKVRVEVKTKINFDVKAMAKINFVFGIEVEVST